MSKNKSSEISRQIFSATLKLPSLPSSIQAQLDEPDEIQKNIAREISARKDEIANRPEVFWCHFFQLAGKMNRQENLQNFFAILFNTLGATILLPAFAAGEHFQAEDFRFIFASIAIFTLKYLVQEGGLANPLKRGRNVLLSQNVRNEHLTGFKKIVTEIDLFWGTKLSEEKPKAVVRAAQNAGN